MTILERVLDYRLRRGWRIVPTEGKSPDHLGKDWQKLDLLEPALRGYFSNGRGYNAGGILGTDSGGLTDSDSDWPVAATLAAYLMPQTRSIFGRPGKPCSHRLYRCVPPVHETAQFRAPDRSMIIELRAKGQTVLPGSTWVDPKDPDHREPVEWAEDGELGTATWEELLRCTEKVAAAALLVPCWAKGSRHDFTLALAGALLHRGWDRRSVMEYIQAIAHAAGETDRDVPGEIFANVKDTARNLEAEKKVTGLPTVAEILGDRAALDKVCKWLHLERVAHEEPQEQAPGPPPPEEGAAPRLLPVMTFGELSRRPHEAQKMLVGELQPAEESTLVTGLERSFKSFYLMEQAICVARGEKFLDYFPTTKAKVLLFDLENSDDRLYDRVHNALVVRGLDDDALGEDLLILDRSHATERLWLSAEQIANVEATLDAFCPDYVILDNLRRAMPPGKTENDTKDMLPIMVAMCHMCEQRKIALAIAHHDRRDGSGPSGSGALLSTPANVIQLQPHRDTTTSTVRCDSMRNCPPFASFKITVNAETGTLVLLELPGGKREGQQKAHHELVEDALKAANRALSVEELEHQTGLTRRQLDPVIDAMVQQSRLVFVGFGLSSGGRAPKLYGLPANPPDREAGGHNDTSFHLHVPIRGGKDEKKGDDGDVARFGVPEELLAKGVRYDEQACIFCQQHLFRPSRDGSGWVCYNCYPEP
jgi:hypothetical protein